MSKLVAPIGSLIRRLPTPLRRRSPSSEAANPSPVFYTDAPDFNIPEVESPSGMILLDFDHRDGYGRPSSGARSRDGAGEDELREAMLADSIRTGTFAELCWSGIPHTLRAEAWPILLGAAPPEPARRPSVAAARRAAYLRLRSQYFPGEEGPGQPQLASACDRQSFWQSAQDAPRFFSGEYPYFRSQLMQGVILRIPAIWAIRNPAAGYVQGASDILLPILTTILAHYDIDASWRPLPGSDLPRLTATDATASFASVLVSGDSTEGAFKEAANAPQPPVPACSSPAGLRQPTASFGGQRDLTRDELDDVEADAYILYDAVLTEHFMDYYTLGQPRIRELVALLERACQTAHPQLYSHIMGSLGSFQVFAFRWFNCHFVRELPLACTCRLFDTIFSEVCTERVAGVPVPSAGAEWHVWFGLALLLRFSDQILAHDGLGNVISFLQNLPTRGFTISTFECVLATSYCLSKELAHLVVTN